MVRRALLATILAVQFGCTPVLAQVSTTTMPARGVPTTSPSLLIVTPGASITPAGIPLGAIASPGLRPMTASATAMPGAEMPGYGTTCTTTSSQSLGTPGLSTSALGASGLSPFNGGGMPLGTTPSSMSDTAVCATGFNSSTSSLASTSNLLGGNVTAPGIPLGSAGIGNAGVTHVVATPVPPPPPTPPVALGLLLQAIDAASQRTARSAAPR
jgi:hypothetical protein